MNRYLVIDLKDNNIYSTNDLKYILSDDLDRFGSSISCIDGHDLMNELEDEIRTIRINLYEKQIKNIKDKEDMKKLVNELFCDDDLADNDFSDLIYQNIIPRLKELGIDIKTYDETTDESGYEKIIKESY